MRRNSLGTSAIAHAEELFDEQHPDRLFTGMLALYLKYGCVVAQPELFAMFRPVVCAAPREQIADPAHTFESPDAWFIYMAIGKLRELWRQMPARLPRICFYRNWGPRLKVYDCAVLERRSLALCR